MTTARSRLSWLAAALAGAALLGGCATFSRDGGLDPVATIARERTGAAPVRLRSEADAARAADEVTRLLAEPLSPEAAVKLAVLNNRGLQTELAELGIAEADLVQAGRLRNPGFRFSRLAGDGTREYERGFLFDLLGLFTLSARTGIERRRFEATQLRVAGEVLELAQSARQAWYSAVAAEQAVAYLESAREAAQAGAELAAGMAEAGNFSRLRRQQEALFLAELEADLLRARLAATRERERLTRLLGLAGERRRYVLPGRLPDLPAELPAEAEVAQQALDRRLDLRLARLEIDGLAKNLGLTRATRLVNVLEAGYLNRDASGEPHRRGYEIELALPLFDWGGARTARAQALYEQALHRVAEIGVNAESEVREAYAGYRTAFDLARHYRDRIVPLRQDIAEEALLRYNGMLIGAWDLLADARRRLAAVDAAIQAQKDFWVAESHLRIALDGGAARGHDPHGQ